MMINVNEESDSLSLAKELFATEQEIKNTNNRIELLTHELSRLNERRLALLAHRGNVAHRIAELFSAPSSPLGSTIPSEVNESIPLWLAPPTANEDETSHDHGAPKPQRVFYRSRDDVRAPVANLILKVLEEDPARKWESVDLITEVFNRAKEPTLQRNKISTFLYRLSKSHLVEKAADGTLSAALPIDGASSEVDEQ
jgi:hypothetical protein